jgi:hypothetical protein
MSDGCVTIRPKKVYVPLLKRIKPSPRTSSNILNPNLTVRKSLIPLNRRKYGEEI